jgi:hypothetical protein
MLHPRERVHAPVNDHGRLTAGLKWPPETSPKA